MQYKCATQHQNVQSCVVVIKFTEDMETITTKKSQLNIVENKISIKTKKSENVLLSLLKWNLYNLYPI